MDWSALVPLVANAAPTIGSLLGGLIPFPGGAILGQVAGKVLAEALGVAPTPDAIHNAITTGDPATVQAQLTEAEVKMQTELEKHKAEIADVQDARHVGIEYTKLDSNIKWASGVVSVIAVFGFCVFSYMAITRPPGADQNVLMYLLGVWSAAFGTVLTYWLGSSSGSSDKSAQIAAMAGTAANVSAKAIAKK